MAYPWISREALELIRDKDRVLARAKRTNNPDEVGKTIQNMRRDFIIEEQQQNLNNPQKFWRNIKSVVPGKKEAMGEISLTVNGNKIKDDEVADTLNSFFAHIGRDAANGTGTPWFSEAPTVRNIWINAKLILRKYSNW